MVIPIVMAFSEDWKFGVQIVGLIMQNMLLYCFMSYYACQAIRLKLGIARRVLLVVCSFLWAGITPSIPFVIDYPLFLMAYVVVCFVHFCITDDCKRIECRNPKRTCK